MYYEAIESSQLISVHVGERVVCFFGNLPYCQAILKNKTSIIQMKLVLHSSRCL